MVMPCSRSASRPSVKQRKIDGVAGAIDLALLQVVQLVGQDGAAVVQQAADERALAVVDAAGGEEAQRDFSLACLGRRQTSEVPFLLAPFHRNRRRVRSSMRVAPRSLMVTVMRFSRHDLGGVGGIALPLGQVQVMSPTVRRSAPHGGLRPCSPPSGGVTAVNGTSRPLLAHQHFTLVAVVQAAAGCSRAPCTATRRARSSC